MKFDHLDLSALGVTLPSHSTFFNASSKPMFQFFGGEGVFHFDYSDHFFCKCSFSSYSKLYNPPKRISLKNLLLLLLFARVSLLFERVKLISHLFPSQALLLLCRPSLSTVYTHLYSLQFLFIYVLLQNVRSHRRKNGEETSFDIHFFKETKSSSQQLESRN